MSVRRAVEQDARSIAEVHVASWQSAYRGLLPEAFLTSISVDRREAKWAALIVDPEQDVFVSEDANGVIVGFTHHSASRDDDAGTLTAELNSIYVHPDYWGLGNGTALVSAVVERSRGRGFRQLTLWVLTTNDPARRFYEHSGFRADGSEKTVKRSSDVVLHECRYRRDLC